MKPSLFDWNSYVIALSFGSPSPPAMPAVPAAVPPVTPTSADVVQAQQDLRRQSLKKRGFDKTVFAGNTGGWMPQNNPNPSPTNPKTPTSAIGTGAKTLGS